MRGGAGWAVGWNEGVDLGRPSGVEATGLLDGSERGWKWVILPRTDGGGGARDRRTVGHSSACHSMSGQHTGTWHFQMWRFNDRISCKKNP
jgi:hypothetical protein